MRSSGGRLMNHATLVLPEHLSLDIAATLTNELETAGVLLVGVGVDSSQNVRLLAREFHLVAESGYAERKRDELTIASDGDVKALARAEEIGAAALWVHMHPGSDASPRPSRRDRKVDAALSELFKLRTGRELYGAVIFAWANGRLTFSGHVDLLDQELSITRLWEVGQRLRLTHAVTVRPQQSLDTSLFDRNIRALGGGVQEVLADLQVGVVGCGGPARR